MFEFLKSSKKLIASLVLSIIVFAPIDTAIQLKQAEATWPVYEIGQQLYTTMADWVIQSLMEMKDFMGDPLFFFLANILISEIADSIIRWANSGFRGSPSFVQDLGGFMRGIADRELGKILEEMGYGFLCSAFKLDVQLQLALSFEKRRDYDPQCTLSDMVGNVEEFLAGDFSQGGWDGWFLTFAYNDNNPHGALLEAEAALRARIVNEQGEQIDLLQFGDGFFSKLSCTRVTFNGQEREGTCNVNLPGKLIEGRLNDALGAGTDRLEIADEMNEVIAAIFAGIVTRIFDSDDGLAGYNNSSLRQEIVDAENNIQLSGDYNPYDSALQIEQNSLTSSEELLEIAASMEQLVTDLCGDPANLYITLPSLRDMVDQAEVNLANSYVPILEQCGAEYAADPNMRVLSSTSTESSQVGANGFDFAQCPDLGETSISFEDRSAMDEYVTNLKYGSPNAASIVNTATAECTI